MCSVMYHAVLYFQYTSSTSVISVNAQAEWDQVYITICIVSQDIVCNNHDKEYSYIAHH